MAYPTSPSETLADGAVHLTGLMMAVPASAYLLNHLAQTGGPYAFVALYAGCLIIAFAASALYHLSPFDGQRALFRRIDHAMIYLLIAGTYTPFVALIGTRFAYGVLGMVWMIAALGAMAKLWFWSPNGRGSLALYLAMGWLAVLLVWPMSQALPGQALWLVVAGGVICSAGTLVFAHPGMRFQNAIWHGMVLVSSVCFFTAVTLSL